MKAQLDARIAALQRERVALQKEVRSLGERLAIDQLEGQARSLEGDVNALRGQKTALQQKLASFEAPAAQGPLPR